MSVAETKRQWIPDGSGVSGAGSGGVYVCVCVCFETEDPRVVKVAVQVWKRYD